MKRILITGENSYIGTSFAEYMEQFKDEYLVETISVRGEEWKNADFSAYDVVYHVAGIAHRKETKENRQLYFDVNFELTKLVANKAKKDGVKQFIFLSSMSVYGKNEGVITKNTDINPTSFYGISKYEAEKYLRSLSNNLFYVSIVRPPMVYGNKSEGNFTKLKKLANICPVFFDSDNKRSMIFIDSLNSYIKTLIEENRVGVFFPQNRDYVNTFYMYRSIRASNGKKTLRIRIPKIKKASNSQISKIFGSLVYSKELDSINFSEYDSIYFEESIKKSVEGK